MKEQKEDIAEFMASFKTSSDYLAQYDIITSYSYRKTASFLLFKKNGIIY